MRNPVFGYFLVNDLHTPPKKESFGKIFLTYVSDDFKTKKNVQEIFFFKCYKKFRIFFSIFLRRACPASSILLLPPPTGAAPLDPACFLIEDPSRNRLVSTAYFAKPATLRFTRVHAEKSTSDSC